MEQELKEILLSMQSEIRALYTEVVEMKQTQQHQGQEITKINVTLENDIKTQLQLLGEGQQGMNEKFAKLDKVAEDEEEIKVKVTALENVMLPALIARRGRAEAEREASELLRMMNLAQRADHKPAALSGGEQQRVAIARALVNRPALLLADEPSGNLDSKNREEIHALFFRLRDELGQTTLIVTHDEELASTADRKIAMRDGIIE